jgi:hypothetical protein
MSRSIWLSGSQFSRLKSAWINDPEGPGKYNNTEVRYWATVYSCHTSPDTCLHYKTKLKMSSVLFELTCAWTAEIKPSYACCRQLLINIIIILTIFPEQLFYITLFLLNLRVSYIQIGLYITKILYLSACRCQIFRFCACLLDLFRVEMQL